MLPSVYSIICGFIPVISYYIFYTLMSNFLNTTILCMGVLLGSVVSGMFLDLFDNQKVRSICYMFSSTIALLIYNTLHRPSGNTNVLLFILGLSFSIYVTDFIKYTVDYVPNLVSAIINIVCGIVILVIAFLSRFFYAINNQHLTLLHIYIKMMPLLLVISILGKNEKKNSIDLVLLALSVLCLPMKINTSLYMIVYISFILILIGYLFFNDIYNPSELQVQEKAPSCCRKIQEYFISGISIFTNWEFYFYLLFLIANTLGMRSGFNALVFKKNIFFIQLGSAFTSILYYFFLPKFSMGRVTWVFLIFLNFLIYFQFFSSSILWYILFGICGASVFLTFIHVMQYKKHMGMVFGILHLTMFLTNSFFDKFALYYNHDKFLTKDLHIILLQVNKKVILHLYGYHLPLIIVTLITLIFYYYNVNKINRR